MILTRNDAVEAGAGGAATKHDVRHSDKDESKHYEQHADPHVASDATTQERHGQEGSEDDDRSWTHSTISSVVYSIMIIAS